MLTARVGGFESIFCKTLRGFWAELFGGLDSLLAYALGWLFHGCLPPLIFEIDLWIDLWNFTFVFPNFSKTGFGSGTLRDQMVLQMKSNSS